MGLLVSFVRLEVAFLLGGLLLVVVYQILTGKINLRGMLNDEETGNLSPGRVQLLAATLFGALIYLAQAATSRGQLPEIPPALVLALGGSNIVYLGFKAFLKGG